VFTGLIREIGTVDAVEQSPDGARLRVSCDLAGGVREGDSVAVSGACLTVARRRDGSLEADVMNQTLRLTTLGRLASGDRVNLEPALAAGDPLGGHLVQGHVDGVAEVSGLADDGFARRIRVALEPPLARYVVEHGSIALDGVSLTVAGLGEGWAEVSLIPETLERTTLASLGEGDHVNVEVDLVARYTERLLQGFRTDVERSTDHP
jgi:riboflavin synthase